MVTNGHNNSMVTNPSAGHGEVKPKVIVMFGLSAVSPKGKTRVTGFISVEHTEIAADICSLLRCGR